MLDNQCPGCGGQLDETTHPHNEDAYEAEPPTRCFKCDALMREQEKFAVVNEHTGKPLVPYAGALLYTARKR
jgi:hypothetical protein